MNRRLLSALLVMCMVAALAPASPAMAAGPSSEGKQSSGAASAAPADAPAEAGAAPGGREAAPSLEQNVGLKNLEKREAASGSGVAAEAEPIETDEWIVVMKDKALGRVKGQHARSSHSKRAGAVRVQAAVIARNKRPVKALIERLEPAVDHQYGELDWAIAGFVVTMEESTARAVEGHPLVKSVERGVLTPQDIHTTVPAAGGTELALSPGGDGAGTRIAIIDSGVDYTHPDLGGGFGPGFKVVGGYDYSSGDANPMDTYGHGTNVAGVAAADGVLKGMAPKAQILAYRVGGGMVSSTAVVQSINNAIDPDGDPATDDGADVINVSSGSTYATFAQAAGNAFAAGVVTCVSMGNSGSAYWTSASSDSDVIGVAADTRPGWNYDIFDFSSRGPSPTLRVKPDVAAPGLCTSTKTGGGYAPNIFGTSFAAPHVAGLVAQLKSSHPDWDAETLRSAAVQGARPFHGWHVTAQGSGGIDAVNSSELRGVLVPATVSFGYADTRQPTWQTSRQMRLRNVSSETKEFSLLIEADVPQGVTYGLDRTSVTLEAGEAATITVTASVDTAVTEETAHPTRTFDGRIVAAADGYEARAPFILGFQKQLAPVAPSLFGTTSLPSGQLGRYCVTWRGGIGTTTTVTYSVDGADVHTYSSFRSKTPTSFYVHLRTLAPGTHVVRARVSNDFGLAESEPITVTVGASLPKVAPAAPSLSAPEPAVTNLTSFTFYGADPNGLPLTLVADWGDGTTSTYTNVVDGSVSGTHSWTTYGPKQVRARSLDASGNVSAWSEPLEVIAHAAPSSVALATGPSVVAVGTEAEFSTSATHADGNAVTIDWNWGDGTITSVAGVAPSSAGIGRKTWAKPGVYRVKAIARDEFGVRSYWSQPLEVVVLGPNPGEPPTVSVPAGVQRTYSSLSVTVTPAPGGDCVGFELDWGDNARHRVGSTPESGPVRLTHTYTSASAHSKAIRARTLYADGETSTWGSATVMLNSVPGAPAVSIVSSMVAGEQNNALAATVSDPDGDYLNVVTEWGDGQTSQVSGVRNGRQTNLQHMYAAAGTYSVNVRTTDGFNESPATPVTLSVVARPTFIDAPSGAAYTPQGASYEPYVLVADGDSSALTYTVSWGDGTVESIVGSSGVPAPLSHAYAERAGVYGMNVSVSDGALTTSRNWTVYVGLPPTNAALNGPAEAMAGTPVEFQAQGWGGSSASSMVYRFDWGDGTESTTVAGWGAWGPASHVWDAEGVYTVRARAETGYGASPWTTREIRVVDPPAAPTGLMGEPLPFGIVLTWNHNVEPDLAGYHVYRDGARLTSVPATAPLWVDSSIVTLSTYSYRVSAVDLAGNEGAQSEAAQVTARDVTSPSVPTDFQATAASESGISLSWSAASDSVGVTGYRIEYALVGTGLWAEMGTSAATSFDGTGLSASTAYEFRVLAFDAAGNVSLPSDVITIVTLDSTAPSAPTSVSTGDVPNDQGGAIDVCWNPSTDNVGVTGYRIRRGTTSGSFSQTADVGIVTSWRDMDAATGATYYYTVSAFDAAGNESALGAEVSASSHDNLAPFPPTGLTAQPGESRVDLAWLPNAEIDLAGYNVYRDGAKLNFTVMESSSFADTGLVDGATYSYRVSAVDTSGNESPPCAEVSATVLVNTPPEAPTVVPPAFFDVLSGQGLFMVSAVDADGDTIEYRMRAYDGDEVREVVRSGASGEVVELTPWLFRFTDGMHRYTVTAVDSHGLSSPQVEGEFRVINTPPMMTSVQGPAGDYILPGTEATFTALAELRKDYIQPWLRYTFDWGDGAPPTRSEWAQDPLIPAAVTHAWTSEGRYTVSVTACDDYDSPSEPMTMTVVVGTPPSAPMVSSSTHHVQDTWYANAAPVLNFSATDASGISGYSYVLDEEAATVTDEVSEGAGTSKSYSALSDGEYYFHVRAVDGAGIWGDTAHYRVRVNTTPPPSNIAPGKPFTASSQFSSTYAAAKAGDGSASTNWRSAALSSSTKTQWLQVDLGAATSINKVVVNWSGTNFATSYVVQTSTNGTTWTTQQAVTAGTAGIKTHTFSTVSARYVRLNCTAYNNKTGYWVNELEVWRAASGSFTLAGGAACTSQTLVTARSFVPGAVSMSFDSGYGFSAPVPYAANTTVSFDAGDGVKTVSARYTDGTGAELMTLSDTIVLDTSGSDAPDVSSSTHPDQGVWYANGSPVFAFSASDVSGISGYSYVLDQSPSTVPGPVSQGSATSKSYSALADGEYYFHVLACDGVGNWGVTAHYRIRIDTTAPSGTMIVAGGVDTVRTTVVSIDSDVVGAAEMRVDTGSGYGAWSLYVPNAQAVLPDVNGSHTVQAQYRDSAGNVLALSDTVAYLRYGPSAPSVTSSTHPNQDTWYSNANPVVSFVATDAAGISGYSYIVDQVATTTPDASSEGTATTKAYSSLAGGEYYFHVRARNAAGEWGGATHFRIRVTAAPASYNAALGKSFTASSQFSSTYLPARAGDGSVATDWRTVALTSSTKTQWLRVDLGAATSVNKVVVNWNGTCFATAYQVQTSTDGTTWTTQYSTTAGTAGIKTHTFPTVSARYVRLNCTNYNNKTGYWVNELEVWTP